MTPQWVIAWVLIGVGAVLLGLTYGTLVGLGVGCLVAAPIIAGVK